MGVLLRTTLQWHPHTRICQCWNSGFSVRPRVTPFIWDFHYWHEKRTKSGTIFSRKSSGPLNLFCSGQALCTKWRMFSPLILTRVYTCGISCSMTGAPSHSSHALNPSFYDKAHASSKDHGLDVDFDMLQFCALKARATSVWECSHRQDRLEDSCWGFAHVLFMIGWMERCNEGKADSMESFYHTAWNLVVDWCSLKKYIPQIPWWVSQLLHCAWDWAETACNNMQRDVTALGPWQLQHLLLDIAGTLGDKYKVLESYLRVEICKYGNVLFSWENSACHLSLSFDPLIFYKNTLAETNSSPWK